MDLNRAMIIGRLTRDPEVRSTNSGQSVTSFSVATNFSWNNKDGEKQEQVEYHNIVAWRKLAEICGQFLKKGGRVYIEGRLQTRSWEGKDGNKRYITEIVADNMIMLDSRGAATGPAASDDTPPPPSETPSNQPSTPAKPAAKKDEEEEEINIEDIPF